VGSSLGRVPVLAEPTRRAEPAGLGRMRRTNDAALPGVARSASPEAPIDAAGEPLGSQPARDLGALQDDARGWV